MEVLEYSNLGKRDRDYEVQEAARTGIDNARKLLHILSHQQRSQLGDEESDAAAGVAVSKFQKVVSLLSRTGHARFRRAPSNPTISGYEYHVAPVGFVPVLPTPTEIISFGKQHQHQQESSRSALMQEKASRSSQVDNSMSSGPPLSTTTKSGFSVVSMDGSGATDNNIQKQQQQTSSALSPAALEPRAQAGGGHHHAAAGNNNKKSSGITSDDNGGAKSSCASVGRCHRSKRRKLRVKHTIKVPAISSKLADIPPDDYSWRKYGQKPIKGSPHPRGYYKCSSMRNCPARKHVERSVEDSSMLIVTYEGEHSHSHTPSTTSTVLTVQS
ncbi:unnamed protein product [Sphagnum jensenii]|uniref:WRKY domain-containing protein n=1 Tax=Sphagnum jensenii TaxID=128206 RepID=A0ABP0WXZ4_9BRYO